MDNFSLHHAQQARSASQGDYKSVQSWKKPKIIAPQLSEQLAQNQIIKNLEKASIGKIGTFDTNLQSANAYADSSTNSINTARGVVKDTTFNFGDVVDIVNPLQHLPLVNVAYRRLTGDQIHPASQIIGGAIYGGPIGALTGTANAISKIQTGKDIGDHALTMAGLGQRSPPSLPEMELNKVSLRIENYQSLNAPPDTALSFVNFNEPRNAIAAYERVQMAQGRTAGSLNVKKNWAANIANTTQPSPPLLDIDFLPAKEKITTLSLSKMPAERRI